MTTMMAMTMITKRTGAITPAMTAILLLCIGDFVVGPSVVGVAEDGTDVVSSMVVVFGDVTGVVSPEVTDVVSPEVSMPDIVVSMMELVVGGCVVGTAVRHKQYTMLKFWQ